MAVAWHSPEMFPVATPKARRPPPSPQATVIEVRRGSSVVKIYRVQNRGRDLFTATWYIAGKRYRKTFSDEKLARTESATIADRLSRGQIQALALTGTDRESYLDARAQLAPLGISLHDAIRSYTAALHMLEGHPLLGAVQFFLKHSEKRVEEKRVTAVYDEFLRQQESDGRSVRYVQDIRSRLGRFAQAFQVNVADVQTEDLDSWLRSLGVSSRTRLNFRALLITFFKFARQNGFLPKNERTAADDLSAPTAEDGEIEIYTAKELQKLIDHSDEHTLPVLCLGAFAGLRTAEIERLTWSNIKWDAGVIEIGTKAAKTRRRRLIPILDPLRKGLFQFRDCRGAIVDHIKLQYRMKALAETSGIKRKSNALRHSFASYRVASIQHVEQVALEMGNSSAMIFQHYRQLVSKVEGDRWWNAESWEFPLADISAK